MYKFHNKTIEMNEIASQMFQEWLDNITDTIITDEDIPELPPVTTTPFVSGTTTPTEDVIAPVASFQASVCTQDSPAQGIEMTVGAIG